MIHHLLIVLAACFKAVADTLADHFSTSVFSSWNSKYWSKQESWKYVPVLKPTGYRPDGWHLANSFMILCFIVCATQPGLVDVWYWSLGIDTLLYIIFFDLVYDHLLKK